MIEGTIRENRVLTQPTTEMIEVIITIMKVIGELLLMIIKIHITAIQTGTTITIATTTIQIR